MSKVNTQKYSKALLEVAQEQNQLETVLAEVNELDLIFQENNLAAFFGNDVFQESAKSQVVDQLKETASPLMKNFLDTVRSNGRMGDLFAIIKEVKNTADLMFKIADVEVVSSVALTEEQIAKFVKLTTEKFDLNEVKIINRVDESILGGFIVNSNGKIIDASIKTQLNKIAQEIL